MNITVNPSRLSDSCEVAIVGAGPYGLAVAAHLRAANVSTRVFGKAMSFWRNNMPTGMLLRSPWIATHIAEPSGSYLLDDYYRHTGQEIPKLLPVENFIAYGVWFQQQVAPDLDTRTVVRVERLNRGFHLVLEDGTSVFALRVVMAAGLLGHEYRPSEFNGLPRDLVNHSCEHTDSARFRGRHIAVVGRGQSACESAALLHEAGANVEIICRGNLMWNADPEQRGTLRKTVRALLGDALIPPSQVGPFPFNWLNEAPGFIHNLPEVTRDWVNRRSLGATAILWLRTRLAGIPVNQGRRILDARRNGNGIALTLDNGIRRFDHVLLATGYRTEVDKMTVLERSMRARISRHGGLPILSEGFESSIPGLHFVGASAVASFGPLLRFIAGAGFAARRVARTATRGVRRGRLSADARLDVFERGGLPLAAEREHS